MIALTTDKMSDITAHLARVGITTQSKMFRGELARFADSPGIRLRYFRPSGLDVDPIGESLQDAGLSTERPTCLEVLELLELVLVDGLGTKRRKVQRVSRLTMEQAVTKARKMRDRKYLCDTCGQIIRGTRATLVPCGRCFNTFVASIPEESIRQYLTDNVHMMRRTDPTPEEVLAAYAGVTL